MSIPRRPIPVLISGLDEKSPKQAGAPGVLDVLQNMVVSKAAAGGGYEMVPRPGTTSQSKTADFGSITSGMRLATLGDQLLLRTSSALYRKATDRWHLVDSCAPTFSVQTSPILSDSIATYSVDSAYVNGYRISAACIAAPGSTQALVISVVDANGATVTVQTVATDFVAGSPRVVVSGTSAIVLWQQTGLLLRAVKIDTATPQTIGSPVTVSSSSVNGIAPPDAIAINSTGVVAVAYLSTATSTWHLVKITVSSMAVSSDVDTTVAGFTAFGLLATDWLVNRIYAAYGSTSGITVATFDPSSFATLSTAVYDATITWMYNAAGTVVNGAVTVVGTTTPDGTNGTLSAPAYDTKVVMATGTSASGGAATVVSRGLWMASKAITANGTTYVMAQYRGEGQGTAFLIDVGAKKMVGKALPDVTGTTPSVNLPGLAVSTSANTLLSAAIKVTADMSSAAGLTAYTGAVAVSWTLGDTSMDRGVELQGLHFPGALPMLYDGAHLVEDGFPIAPEISDTPAQSTSGGGGLTLLARYIFRYVYAWTDAAGNIHRSAPSILSQSVDLTGTNNQIDLSIPTLRLSRRSGVAIEVYASVANGDGATYFMVTDPAAPLLNDPTVDRVSFTFAMTDDEIVAGLPLYTNGGILDNIAPPPCKTYAVHRGRILIGGVDDDPQGVWFSKDVSPGFGVSFSDGLVSRMNATTEPVTAVASMDAYAVAFTAHTTWASGNDYPDDIGNGGVLMFQQYSNQTGVAGPGLFGRNDQGLVAYAGSKGAWRMSRGVSYDYVGSAVENTLAGLMPVAIVGVPGQSQIRIISGTTALVYETLYGTWAKWTYAQTPASFADAVIWRGSLTYLCSDGTVVLEDTSVIDDDTRAVAHRVTFSGLNPAGIAGFWRLCATQFIGRAIGTGGFTLVASQVVDGIAIPDKSIVYAGTETELNAEVDPGTYGKCSRYEVTLSDTANGANSAFSVVGATLLAAFRDGLNKLPPARRMT